MQTKTLTKHLAYIEDQYQPKEKKLYLPKSFLGDSKEKSFRIVPFGFLIKPFDAILNYYYLSFRPTSHPTHFYENSKESS